MPVKEMVVGLFPCSQIPCQVGVGVFSRALLPCCLSELPLPLRSARLLTSPRQSSQVSPALPATPAGHLDLLALRAPLLSSCCLYSVGLWVDGKMGEGWQLLPGVQGLGGQHTQWSHSGEVTGTQGHCLQASGRQGGGRVASSWCARGPGWAWRGGGVRQRGFRSPWGCWAEWLRGGRAGGELGEGGYASPAGKLIRPAVAGGVGVGERRQAPGVWGRDRAGHRSHVG